jgi:Ca2+-binding RTX toxin-like protein
MTGRRDRWAAPLVGAVLLVASTAQPAAAALAGCTFSAGTITVTVHPNETPSVLSRSNDSIMLDGQVCQGATVTNTNKIKLTKTESEEAAFAIDLSQPFGPGATAEATGTSEIEFEISLGVGVTYFDVLELRGSSGVDNYVFGRAGVNLNGDDDADMTYTLPNETFLVFDVDTKDGNDVINGNGGHGTGDPSNFPLRASGGPGDDDLTGSEINDVLEGGPGADAIDGGDTVPNPEWNVASYANSTAGVNVDLATGSASGGDAQGDTLERIDSVYGSEFADTLKGNAQSNVFSALGGDDTIDAREATDGFQGGPGADVLEGGEGYDYLAYVNATGPVQIDLAAGTASGNDATGDTYSGAEALLGSEFGDELTGDNGSNDILAFGGNDVINGSGGDDTIEGGHGEDTEMGGPGDDYFWAGYEFDDDDEIDGGPGVDYINYHGRGVDVTLSLDGKANDGAQGERDNIVNVEKLGACHGNDVIVGSAKDDIVIARQGNDKVDGGGGDDRLDGGPGKDVLRGGSGDDVCVVTPGDKVVGCERTKRRSH